MNKKIKIIFTLSFLLNIVLIGIVLGGMYHNKSRYKMDGLEGPVKELLKKNMGENREAMRDKYEQMKIHKQQLKEIVVASDFDKAAFDAKMAEILKIKSSMSERKAQVFGKTLSELSQQDRQALSHKLLKEISGKGHKRHKGDKYMKNKGK